VERLPSPFGQLIEAAALVARQAELTDVLRTTVRTAMSLTDAEHGALGVFGPHGLLSDFIYEGIDRATAELIGHPPSGGGLLGSIKEPIRLDDIATHPAARGFPPHHPPMTSFLGVPVRLADQRFGSLYLADKTAGPFTEEDQLLVTSLAVIAGSAISRARLEQRLEHALIVEDRERIARDMHDGVIQDLFAVGLALQTARHAEPDEVADQLTRAMKSIDEAMTGLRSYIFDLQVPEPDFEARLLTMISGAASDAHVDVDVEDDFSGLDHDVATHLTSFVREAVSNAIRHGRATDITVTARTEDSTIVIEVSDNGVGFDTGAVHDGLGLANMRERMSVLGGVCEITSSPGTGTVARGIVPAGSPT
jgi:signal transduction histidine kinase